MEVAGQQHVIDVVTCAVVKFPHVEGSWLEIVEVSFDLQTLKNTLLHKMNVPDLIPGQTERKKKRVQRNILHCTFLNAHLMSCSFVLVDNLPWRDLIHSEWWWDFSDFWWWPPLKSVVHLTKTLKARDVLEESCYWLWVNSLIISSHYFQGTHEKHMFMN